MPQLPSRPARVLALVGCATVAGTAAAQTPSAPADTAPRRDSVRTLAPVVVTVLRTPFTLDRAPYALSVLSKAEVQRGRPGFNLAEGLVAVPGVQVDNRYNYALGERISVRGFGARAQFGVRGIRILFDDIPATLPDGQTTLNHVDVAALGRAEVVRGPASALYGNAAGGVLQLESEPAQDGRIDERVRVLTGADGLNRWQSTTSGRLTTGSAPAAYTLNVSQLRYDGYRTFSDARNTYLASTLDLGGADTRVRIAVHGADYSARNPGSIVADSLVGPSRYRAFANNVRQQTGEDGRHGEVGVTLRQTLGRGELRASSYGIVRSLENPIPNTYIDLKRQAGGGRLAYGMRHALAGRSLQWVVGTEVQAQRDDRQNYVNNLGEPGALTLDQKERVTTLAGFAQAAAELAPRLAATAALRYDRARFSAADRLVSATNPDDSGERTLHAASPSAGVSYALGRGSAVYANLATSFETPTTTELANRPTGAGGFNPELEPQRTTSVELGTNTRVGRFGAAQVALYNARIRNALIPFEVAGAPGRQFYRNAGTAVHRGVEAGFTVTPRRDVSLRGAYTYTEARFDDYSVANVSYTGKRVPGVSPHRVDGVLSYARPRGLFVELEERYLAPVPVIDANTPGTASPAYALTNVRAGLQRLRVGGVAFAPTLGVTNLLDRVYNTAVSVNAFGRRYYEPGPGRAVYAGIELSAGAR